MSLPTTMEKILEEVQEKSQEAVEEQQLVINIDFGGVLSIHDRDHNGGEHRNTCINMADALDALKLLKSKGHLLYLNSFCGKSRAIETQKSIEMQCDQKIFEDLYFVKSKQFKGIVTDALEADIMIDDTLDILLTIRNKHKCPILIWFVGDPSFDDTHNAPKGILKVSSWQEILQIIFTVSQSKTKKEKKLAQSNKMDLAKFIYIL
jgi:hypothetical protein